MSTFSQEELEEFHVEATELLDEAEEKLLELDRGGEFPPIFDAVFRVFHSLKGASGFLGLQSLQSHMHKLEDQYQSLRPNGGMTKLQIGYFLNGIDCARRRLAAEDAAFDYTLLGAEVTETLVEKKEEIIQKTPVTEPKPVAPPVVKASEPASSLHVSGTLAFVVGIESANCEGLIGALEELGHSPQIYEDVFEALAKADSELPALFIMPMSFPTFEPEDCAKLLRSSNPAPKMILTSVPGSLLAAKDISLGIIDPNASRDSLVSHLKNLIRLGEVEKDLEHTLSVLFDRLPDIALSLEQTGKHELLQEVDREFRNLVAQRRQLKVS